MGLPAVSEPQAKRDYIFMSHHFKFAPLTLIFLVTAVMSNVALGQSKRTRVSEPITPEVDQKNIFLNDLGPIDPNVKKYLMGTTPTGVFVEYFDYEEFIYSRSRKTEIGDQLELNMALRYQITDSTFGRFRFDTDPSLNRFDNKTSEFEFLIGHVYNNFYFQVDSLLNVDDQESSSDDTSGLSIGLDLDSEDTLISYKINNNLLFTFFPFNFGGEVGRTFNTGDVNRIYFVDGSPNAVNDVPTGDEKLAEKTIGGFQLTFLEDAQSSEGWMLALAGGAATYEYPGNASFNILNSTLATTTRWERREDIGYKALLRYTAEDFRFEGRYVGHTQASETGALLEAAGSAYMIHRLGRFVYETEYTVSKAGGNPYEVSRGDQWFANPAPWFPVFTDANNELENWIGEVGSAFAIKVGMESDGLTPYISYRHHSEHFVYRERFSAHLLRTALEEKSHGGLDRFGIGAYFRSGQFVLNPEVEYMVAQNDVFSNAGDLRRDRQNATFQNDDFSIFLKVQYRFDRPRPFEP
ncbi:MAG: hypothetical protein HRT45_02435 [Bdellovibrionales bacterium]|nr:hypothetical protein [Bdellovibrionales bacterium]